MAEKLYCLCRKPYQSNEFMIECEICKDWFHGRCVNIQEHQSTEIETYHCPSCQLKHGPLVLKKRRNIQRPNYSESDDNICKMIKTGTMTFVRELKQRTFASATELPVVRLSGHELTKEYLENRGFILPILIDKKDGLDMKVPPSNFSVQDVENYVGSMRELDVIDVACQDDFKMLMRDWTDYYNSPDRRKIYNVISLEFSNTRLAELVEPPRIVRELSWVGRFWPKSTSMAQDGVNDSDRPEIQRYCLMGVKDSYTDFHIDFGGTSVWYHILWGEKVFYFIRPTAANLSLYERWTSSSNQNQTFFGDQVDVCYRCVIKQGQTVIIPTGWIHAVLTPIDSLVFGGNFLHSYSIDMQLKIYEMEKRVQTPDKYLIPHYESLHWYAAGHFLDYLTGVGAMNIIAISDVSTIARLTIENHLAGRMPPQYLIDGIKSLCSALRSWLHKKEAGKLALVPAVVQPAKLLKELQKELKNFLNAKERASLQELIKDPADDEGNGKSKRTRKKRSNSTLSPKKLPGASLLPDSLEPLSPNKGSFTFPEKAEVFSTSELPLSTGKLTTDSSVKRFKAEPSYSRQLSGDIASIYDFKDDGIGELEVEIKDSDARWVEGLATTTVASPPLKLKVTGGKISGQLPDKSKGRQFVPLTSLSQGSSTLSVNKPFPIANDSVKVRHKEESEHDDDLIVDESSARGRLNKSQVSVHSMDEVLALKTGRRNNKTQSPVNSGLLKLKLAVSAQQQSLVDPLTDDTNSVEFAHRLSIPVIRGGLNSNISDILEASGYGTETDIRIDDDYSRASPTMRDAIQGMLSMSCGSRLLSGSSLLRSPSSATTPVTSTLLPNKRLSSDNLTEDINAKLMTCYKDNEFVYPSLDLSDSEDTSKSKARVKSDDAWNPKAKVTPSCPKPNRPQRPGARREAVENGLAAAAAKLGDMSPEKRPYAKRKHKPVKKTNLQGVNDPLSASVTSPSLALSATSSLLTLAGLSPTSSVNLPNVASPSGSLKPTTPATGNQQKGSLPKKFKKGQATVKQRLASKLKMHKMMF